MLTPQLEAVIRFGCFFGTLLAMAVWELLAPRRPLTQSKPLRWFSNLGLDGSFRLWHLRCGSDV